MLQSLSGATRVHLIVGDPIAQAKSPAGLTRRMAARGANHIVVPAWITAADFETTIAALKRIGNVGGIVATVPHKFAALATCDAPSKRARFVGAANVLRRRSDGLWEGDHFDGAGFCGAAMAAGFVPGPRPALVVGAGGAGSAIAFELLSRGVRAVAVHDIDIARRDGLVARLEGRFPGRARAGDDDPTEYAMVVNATPCGMRSGDAVPFRSEYLASDTFVGCVVTGPDPSSTIIAAGARGCRSVNGSEMFEAQADRLVDYLLQSAFLPDGTAPR